MIWGALVAGGLALLGLGTVFVASGLDRADKLGSVIGAFAALIGLGLSAYGIVLTRRDASPAAAGQPPGDSRTDANRPADQRVWAGRDAYIAGRDQHFGAGPPSR